MITVIEPSFYWPATTLQMFPLVMEHIERCGRVCYKSEDRITPISMTRFVEMICKNGHESVLEHASLTAIIVCSRACSHQLVRHRIAAYCIDGEAESVLHCHGRLSSGKPYSYFKRRKVRDLFAMKQTSHGRSRLRLVKLNCLNEATGEIVANKVRDVVYTGCKPCVEIEVEGGYCLRATKDHLFFTPVGWRRLEDIITEKLTVAVNGVEQEYADYFKSLEPIRPRPSTERKQQQLSVHFSSIMSWKEIGPIDTYDIVMDAPHHNFIANGLVVHNSQESQRFCNYKSGLQVICPASIGLAPGDYESFGRMIRQNGTVIDLPPQQERWIHQVDAAYAEYKMELAELKPEDARYVLPNATKTELAVTFNCRQWRHVFRERALNSHAQGEIRGIFSAILVDLKERLPAIFGDLRV